MCYNSTISFAFAAVGLSTSIYIQVFQPALASTRIHYILLFYTAMEFLQSIQYYFVNQCHNIINRFLTEVAYVLVIVQPFMWNLFFYINSNGCDTQIFIVGMTLALIWLFLNIVSRLFYTPNNALSPHASIFASHSSCTKQNTSHLFWQWPSANFNDLTPNYLMYLLIWFIPGMVSKEFRIPSIVTALFACIGAMMSIYANEIYIWPSVWCYISVPMVITLIVYMHLL